MNNKELQKILDMLPEDFTFKAVYEEKYEKELTQQENPIELIVEQEELDRLEEEYWEERELIWEWKYETEWDSLSEFGFDILTELGINLPDVMIENAQYFESWSALELELYEYKYDLGYHRNYVISPLINELRALSDSLKEG